MKKWLFLCFWCYSSWLVAQNDTLFKANVKEIMALPVVEKEEESVTTASKKAETILAAPASMTVITAKEIEAFGANTLQDILDRVTSMYPTGSFFNPEGMVTTRGIYSIFDTRTLLLLNGRPIREALAFRNVYATFPIFSLEKIEIIRGSGSVLYGSGAYACVINLITKTPSENGKLQVRQSYGSFGTWQTNIGFSKKIKDFSISAYGNYVQSEGWEFSGRGETDMALRNGQEVFLANPRSIKMLKNVYSAVLKANYKNFYAQYFYSQFFYQSMSSQSPTWTPYFGLGQIFEHYGNIGYKNQWGKLRFQADFTQSSIRRLGLSQNTQNLAFGNNTGTILLGELYAAYQASERLSFSIGTVANYLDSWASASARNSQGIVVDWVNQKNNDPFLSIDNSEMWYSAYFQADYKLFPFLKIDLGGQFNKAGDSDLNFVPRFNAVFNWQDRFFAKLIYGEAFRSPSMVEKYSNTRLIHSSFTASVVGGGKNLNPETIRTTEIQMAYKHAKFQAILTYFTNFQNSIISNSSPSDSLVVATAGEIGKKLASPKVINRGSISSQGIEIEGKTTAFRNFYLTTSYSFFAFEQGSGRALPTNMFKIGFSYQLPKMGLQMGLFNSYFGEVDQFVTLYKTANPDAKAYHFMTFNLQWNLRKMYEGSHKKPEILLNMYVTNLLNEEIYYPEYARRIINTIQGRSERAFYASLQWNFGK